MALVSLVNWIANVILPLYAALQVAAGALDLATDVRFHYSSGWMRSARISRPSSTIRRQIAHHIENKPITVNRQ
ncbi:MAG TPA: hypothetical protein VKM93_18055 [Terriglobia bacterium]|nr:hypothetical protein [Terriglobia bacterium]